MMPLPSFRLERPTTLAEATRLLAEEPGARAVAGGTDLLVSMKQGLYAPPLLVDLQAVAELRGCEVGEEGARLGALGTLSALAADPAVRQSYPALAQAAAVVASPPLRNRATLGGNVCLDTRCHYFNQSPLWRQSKGYCLKCQGDICQAAPGAKRCFAVFSADTVPALIALGARVVLARWAQGSLERRELPLEELYVEEGIDRTTLAPGEVVVEVRLPAAQGVRSGYRKYRQRASIDYPLAGVAVALRLEAGVMRDVRIAVGALASAPLVARQAMALLEGAKPEPGLLEQAAQRVTEGTRPVANQAGSPAHRRLMARVLCRRLLEELTAG